MKNLNHIGLDQHKSETLAKNLNELLANYSLLYQNVRGFHWKIKGQNFFELHLKFEELYNDLFLKIDEVAERILTLGYEPEHRFSIYQTISEIKETNETQNGLSSLRFILEAFKSIIQRQRAIMELSAEISDEGTNSQMSDYIREQEKMVWMYSAYLNE